jgi:hypothetical protein
MMPHCLSTFSPLPIVSGEMPICSAIVVRLIRARPCSSWVCARWTARRVALISNLWLPLRWGLLNNASSQRMNASSSRLRSWARLKALSSAGAGCGLVMRSPLFPAGVSHEVRVAPFHRRRGRLWRPGAAFRLALPGGAHRAIVRGEYHMLDERGRVVVVCVGVEAQRQQKRAVPRLSRERARKLSKAEPTGVEFSVTNFLPLPYPVWKTVSEGATPSGGR